MKRDQPAILHVMDLDKFIAPFIDFVETHFADFGRHRFFCFGDESRFPVRRRPNTRFRSDFSSLPRAYLALAGEMNRSDRIILHGLFNIRVVQLLALQPWVLGKCYWAIWGGDLYGFRSARRDKDWHRRELVRKFVIKRIGHLVTYTEGDVDLARQWYGARGRHHRCLTYPSNLYRDYSVPPKTDTTVNIQIGNSADPGNEHFEMLRRLERYKDENIRIYAPLSYGDPGHAKAVADEGARIFGEKFVPLTAFMPFEEYLGFLGKIDIAVFNHRRQQGMGNITTLLGLGKKVYLRPDVTSRAMFEGIGITVCDSADIDLSPLDRALAERNHELIKRYFSERVLVDQLRELFEDGVADA